jgi:putative restriction endonuclease
VPVGTLFSTRQAAFDAGVHRHTQAGIAGTYPAAQSIVLSGGYRDDIDLGDEIFYTGYGGRDPGSGQQVADQELKSWNWALAQNRDLGLPVRVIRGADPTNPFAPAHGYRYDGLYDVVDFSPAEGKKGFRIFHYRLLRRPGQDTVPRVVTPGQPPGRTAVTVARIDRDPGMANAVKEIYGHRCQVSRTAIATPAGPYAEAAHIRALGRPHNGVDDLSNLLCLCPNDHVKLDRGVLVVSDSFEVVEARTGEVTGELLLDSDHWIDPEAVKYHRYVWTELLSR